MQNKIRRNERWSRKSYSKYDFEKLQQFEYLGDDCNQQKWWRKWNLEEKMVSSCHFLFSDLQIFQIREFELEQGFVETGIKIEHRVLKRIFWGNGGRDKWINQRLYGQVEISQSVKAKKVTTIGLNCQKIKNWSKVCC